MNDYLLKILSGPHIGAELELTDSRYLIGQDDECDLVLCDENLNARHFVLHLHATSVQLELLTEQTNVYINGESRVALNLLLDVDDIITIGSFHFSVGTKATDWASLRIPEIHADQVQTHESQVALRQNGSSNNHSDDAPEGDMVSATGQARYFRNTMMAFAGSGLVVVLVVAVFLNTLFDGKVQAAPIVINGEQLNQMIEHQLNLTGLTIYRTPAGDNGVIEGYVETTRQLKSLSQWLRQKKITTTLRIKTIDELVTGAQMALSAMGYKTLSVSPGTEAGEIVLAGDIVNKNKWRADLSRLRDDLPAATIVADAVGVYVENTVSELKLRVKSIHMGDVPYFITETGEKFANGSTVAGIYTVENVTSHTLYLRHANQRIEYKISPDYPGVMINDGTQTAQR